MTTNKIPFAIREGRLIDVTQADKKIDYSCPDCSSVLRKRGGDIVTDHFYHYTPSECTGESVIHKAYKQALLECKKLCYRDYQGSIRILKFDKVELEKGFNGGSIIVDAVGYINNIMYFIEFANTHFIDKRKKKKIEKSNIFCIEIIIPRDIKTFDKIKNFLSDNAYNRSVIHNPKSATIISENAELKKQIKSYRDDISELKATIKKYKFDLKELNKSYDESEAELDYYQRRVDYEIKRNKGVNEQNKNLKEFVTNIDTKYLDYRITLKENLTFLRSFLKKDMFNNSDKVVKIIRQIEDNANNIVPKHFTF